MTLSKTLQVDIGYCNVFNCGVVLDGKKGLLEKLLARHPRITRRIQALEAYMWFDSQGMERPEL